MKSYQTLSVVGGVLGMILVFLAGAALKFLSIASTSFGGTSFPDTEQVKIQIIISVILYIIAIILPFVVKRTKILGGVLLGLAVATLISAGGFGILGFALLIAAGIAALRWKPQPKTNMSQNQQNEISALEILKKRLAKGEITKEDFDKMRKDIEN